MVIGVTQVDRPTAAPKSGDFDLGFNALGSPNFTSGMVASATIFASSASGNAFVPVISEMRRPEDFKKSVYVAYGFVTSAYLALSLVVYRWCGAWVASPSLGVRLTFIMKSKPSC